MKKTSVSVIAMSLAALAPIWGAASWAADSQLKRDMSRACERINLSANDLADCRTRYSAAKNDSEREQVLKFFATGGDQSAADPDSEGHAVSGRPAAGPSRGPSAPEPPGR